jgi:hypothetical protein
MFLIRPRDTCDPPPPPLDCPILSPSREPEVVPQEGRERKE